MMTSLFTELQNLQMVQKIDLTIDFHKNEINELWKKENSLKAENERLLKSLTQLIQRKEQLIHLLSQQNQLLEKNHKLYVSVEANFLQMIHSEETMTIDVDRSELESIRGKTALIEQNKERTLQEMNHMDFLIENHKTQFESFQKEKQEAEVLFKKKKAELESSIKKEMSIRQEYISCISSNLLKTYERIRVVKNGVGIALLDKGVCSACRVQVPPQRQMEIARSTEVLQCLSCKRILTADALLPEKHKSNDATTVVSRRLRNREGKVEV